MLTGGSFRRLGFILTDYTFKYNFNETWLDVSPEDPWESYPDHSNTFFSGEAVKNQTDVIGDYIYPGLYNMRSNLMWGGTGLVFVNSEDEDTECGWEKL